MMRLLRRGSFWGALLLAVGVCAAVYIRAVAHRATSLADPNSARKVRGVIPVRTVQVVQEKVDVVIGGTAMTVASQTGTIQFGASSSSGESNPVVKAVHVADGELVKRNQVLFEIADQVFRANVQQREAAVRAAASDVKRAEAVLADKGKLRELAMEAAKAELKRADAVLADKGKLRELAMEAAKAEVKRAQAVLADKGKFRELAVEAANAELKRAQAVLADKGKLRELALEAAKAELKRAQTALTDRAKLRRLTLAEAEIEVERANKAATEKVESRKLHLEAAEADVKSLKAELEIGRQYIDDVKAIYKKKEHDSKAVEIYYHALSQYEKTRAMLSRAQKDLRLAKNDTVIGPLTDQEAVAKAEKILEHARIDMLMGPLADEEAVAKAKKGLQQATNDMSVGSLSDQEAVAKAKKALQQATNDMDIGPLADQEAVAKAQKALQQATNDMDIGPLMDQEAVAKARKALQQATNDMDIGPLVDQEAVAKARSSLSSAQAHLISAQKELDNCQLKAPFAGLVEGLNVSLGTSIKQHASLAQILQVDPIFVKMDFPQERLGDVALGQEAEVVLDSFPSQSFKGTVVRIGARVDSHLRTLPVYIKVGNATHQLRPGVSGFARIRSVKLAMVIPAAALVSHEQKSVVFCVEQGRAKAREVQAGATVKTSMVEVCSGLTPGDEIIIYTNFFGDTGTLVPGGGYVKDNDLVDTDWRKWARRHD
jgi:RND family efflux transporter MFP subunit